MYGYDLSSRRRMLKGGRCCLMKRCSASRASASFWVATKSIDSTRDSISSAPRAERPLKCEPTRLRIDFALPTYSARPPASLNR